MGLVDRLNRLDEHVFKGLRRPGEDPERYLRRVAVDGPSRNELLAVQQALREHFAHLDAERAQWLPARES